MRFERQPAETAPTKGPITAENWLTRAASHCAAGEGFVIRALEGAKGALGAHEAATEAQWIAWMTWFSAHGISTRAAIANGVATVPTEWPEQFDPAWPPSDRSRRLPRPRNGREG